jgi:hypothetical protein
MTIGDLRPRFPRAACAAVGILALAGAERAASACGAAVVSRASIAASAQRIFLSVHGGKTDIVVQVIVPSSPSDYGALLPLPSEPTLDPMPVDSAELDALDRATAVTIVEPDGGGGGCGCGSADDAGGGPRGPLVGTVNIGPVTAATLRADDAAALEDWLGDNGFALSTEHRSLITSYAGAGRFFVAIRRNGAVANAPDSIGIHLTLDGDRRGLPLRATRVGAASELAFTIFVAAPEAAGPAAPYSALLVTDLNRDTAIDSYGVAVAQAVSIRGSRAFVAEYRGDVSPATSFLGPRLRTLVAEGQTLTRYSTVLAPASIEVDADFSGAAPGTVPTIISSRAAGSPRSAHATTALLLAAVAAFGLARARRRR